MSLPPLQPEQLVKPSHFELRISLIFAALFIPLGVHVPYFPLWLEAKGFDPEEIGIILAAPMFLRVVTTPLITAAADRSNDRANWLIGTVVLSLLLSFGYFLPPTYFIVLAVSLVLTIFWTVHSPLSDSLALSGVRRFGSSYTAMRSWGSAAFLAGSFFGGIILAATSADAVPVMISAGLAGTLAAALLAPRLGKPRMASPLSATDLKASAPPLFNRYFLLIVSGVGVITASHAFLYGFVSIYWKSIGIDEGVVGLLWSAGVVAEVAVFMLFTRVFGTISASAVLAIAGVASIVRWLAFPLIEPLGLGVAGFLAVQTLHSLSTGLCLIGLQKVIGETVAEERTGAAQGVAFFANGFFMAAVTLLCGPLYDRLHGDAFYVMAAIALAGLGLVWLASRSAPERRLRR
jgi:PPP family 3-phenylpropionic acid transporter